MSELYTVSGKGSLIPNRGDQQMSAKQITLFAAVAAASLQLPYQLNDCAPLVGDLLRYVRIDVAQGNRVINDDVTRATIQRVLQKAVTYLQNHSIEPELRQEIGELLKRF